MSVFQLTVVSVGCELATSLRNNFNHVSQIWKRTQSSNPILVSYYYNYILHSFHLIISFSFLLLNAMHILSDFDIPDPVIHILILDPNFYEFSWALSLSWSSIITLTSPSDPAYPIQILNHNLTSFPDPTYPILILNHNLNEPIRFCLHYPDPRP